MTEKEFKLKEKEILGSDISDKMYAYKTLCLEFGKELGIKEQRDRDVFALKNMLSVPNFKGDGKEFDAYTLNTLIHRTQTNDSEVNDFIGLVPNIDGAEEYKKTHCAKCGIPIMVLCVGAAKLSNTFYCDLCRSEDKMT